MIRYFAVIVWSLFPIAIHAAPVIVKSGEHDGFTRLVMDLGAPITWRVGRSLDGYALHFDGAPPTYDLTQAFALIGKGRLAALWADPESGDLRIGIACACHALPFEFRPGIVVIDLKDGPPPKGSSFELAIDGSSAPALAGRDLAMLRPKPRPREWVAGYDWLQPPPRQANTSQGAADASVGTISDLNLEPLRKTLMWQLSKGAAEGVVDLTMPSDAHLAKGSEVVTDVETSTGEDFNNNLGATPQELAAQGQPCITNDALDLASWGTSDPIADQLANRQVGLLGEFDRPESAAITKAVKLNLFLGFGVEARQLLIAFPFESPERAVWSSLAHLLDDDEDMSPAFAGLAACDSAAALWAVLTGGSLTKGPQVNAPAVLLAFSRLPLHLRRQLAPRLTERFLAMRDQNSARAVKDAVMRAPDQESAEMAQVGAEIDMSLHDPRAAEAALAPMLRDSGTSTPDVIVSFVEARVAQNLPIKAELVSTLAGLVRETPEGKDRSRVVLALIVSQAASGDFDSAFAGLSENPDAESDLWRLLATIGTDGDLLNHAVLGDGASDISVDEKSAEVLAQRLSDLDFAAAAGVWLDKVSDPLPELVAEVALKLRDPRKALRTLAGTITTPEVEMLKRQAYGQLGDQEALAEAYFKDGDAKEGLAALARASDWERLEKADAGPWQVLASTLNTAVVTKAPGQLAAAHQLTETSQVTQTAAAALLNAVPMP